MSEGGQRGTGDDYVLYLFFKFFFFKTFPHGEVRGETEQTFQAAGRTIEGLKWL